MSSNLATVQMAPHEVLAANGKTFHWAKRFLGDSVGEKAAILYQFCRLADDIADGGDTDGADMIATMRDAIFDDAVQAPEFLRSFLGFADRNGIDRQAIHDLLTGMLQDQGNVALASEKDLLGYAYRVAGTVGLMMLPIIGSTDRKARAFAIDLGIAMQLTNIARDICEDAEMGRRYIPATVCNNVSPRLIRRGRLIPMHREHIRASADYLLRLADRYYASAYRGLAYLPLRSHIAIGIAGHCYQAIGHKIRRHHFEVWRGRTFVSLAEKIIASLFSLTSLRYRLGAPTKHRPELHQALDGVYYDAARRSS
jgi:phytoene synthase